ncbi:uncharacterized protein LOC128033981 [Gossypium raimondii]|uniref:uncharacterized protein LOC128033981 n=1 Tax=Gossypium raimondii TaxID=29730 RepID=UPI00227A6036|nr:uncharacterized protein LOC128033981 [Gossypium raimondii]
MSENLRILVESTTSEVTVLSPLGESVKVNKLFRDIPLEGQGAIFLADLMELPFGEFDLILGMYWLVKHQVSLDCATKRVVLRTEEDGELVRKGCEAYLTYITVSNSGNSSVKDIRMVKDFPDVFPEELIRLHPNRQVEFGIELLFGTAPVLRFGRKGKLSPRFFGPYLVLKRVGLVAYQLELPPELDQIDDVFNVSILKRYHSDLTHIVPVEEIEVTLDLTFEEEPTQILDCDVKVLRRKSTPLVKVFWRNHSTEEATWEPEDVMRQQYPHLF